MTTLTNNESKSPQSDRWDPSKPGFIPAVFHTMLWLGLITTVIGTQVYCKGFLGFFTGSALALVLYRTVMQAGVVFTKTGNFSRVMRWLLLSQVVLWLGMALLLVWVKVNPIGFVIGVSIIPASIVFTLAWYTIQGRRSRK